MSGHSKWATIHRQKEVKDAKKGAIFTKLGAMIVVAVRQGGGIGDPEKNFRLRLVMDQARQCNMPKENISRAIEKGMGGAGDNDLIEMMYEGFLPGGVAVMIQVMTDNKARTVQQVRMVLEKHGGTLASSGAVGYMFSPKEEIYIKLAEGDPKTPEEHELEIIDMPGVEDIEVDREGISVYCDKDKILPLKTKLEESKYLIESIDLIMKPETVMKIADEQIQSKIEETLNALEELDDVAHVFTSYVPE